MLERALEASVVQCRERQQSADLAGEHYQRALCRGLTPNELFERSLEIEGLGDAASKPSLPWTSPDDAGRRNDRRPSRRLVNERP